MLLFVVAVVVVDTLMGLGVVDQHKASCSEEQSFEAFGCMLLD